MKRKSIILFISIVLTIILASITYACGCGLAISEMNVFNSLKETQAYLMIDIVDETTYSEMPFFRMISLDDPYNVTIVFPIDGIPYDVEGDSMSVGEFLQKYNISIAEESIEKQSFSGLVNKLGKDLKESSPYVLGFASGGLFFGLGTIFTRSTFGESQMVGRAIDKANLAPIAHFEFEGGSLDIYDINSMNTLKEFVETINITLTGKVEELITKYNDYYVAVLYLKVPSAVDKHTRDQLKSCPERTEKVKQALQETSKFNFDELSELTGIDDKYLLNRLMYFDPYTDPTYLAEATKEYGECSVALVRFINSVTSVNENVNGTLVTMKFSGTNEFFYPTSIVNSYKYPITDQKYFIKAPSNLDIDLSSSVIDKKATLNDERWYKVTSTEEDIKGEILKASLGVRTKDKLRLLNQLIYNQSGWFILLFYLIIITLPFIYYFKKINEELKTNHIMAGIILFITVGGIISSIVIFSMRKWKYALTILFVWVILLLLTILTRFI